VTNDGTDATMVRHGGAALAALGPERRADGEPMTATIAIERETAPIDAALVIELLSTPP
jgi:hypothetical protein